MCYTYKEELIRTKNKKINYWIVKRYEGGKLLCFWIDIMRGYWHENPQPKLKVIFSANNKSKKEFNRLVVKIKNKKAVL